MAVLVEGISVIVRRWDVNRRYPGGFRAYRAEWNHSSLCTDGRLVRAGFGTADEALAFVARLQSVGFVSVSEGRSIDSCLVDQRQGMVYRADWLDIFRFPYQTGSLTLASLAGDDSARVAVPKGWRFEDSLSARVPTKETDGAFARQSA
jgi:hypothetical protein